MRRALLALALAGCTVRAPIPPPRVPLAATPAAAMPAPPTERWPEQPLQLRLTRHTLGNGFRIVIARGEANGTSTVAFVSHATPRWDQRAPQVVTAWMSQMLLRATRTEDGVVDDLLSRRGFSPALEVGASGLIVHESLPREELPSFLRSLDLVLRQPELRAEDLAHQVEAHTDRVEGELTSSAGLLDDRAPSLLYDAADPRAQGMSERLETIRALDVDTLRARHAELLDPSRSAIVVTGDVDPQVLLPFLGRLFGAWPTRPSTPTIAPVRYRQGVVPRGRVVVRPALRAYLRLVERAPAFTHPDYAAFLVLEQILGGMFASRLNLAVREGSGASYGFHANYGASATEGAIEMETSVDPAYTRSVLVAMITELRRVRGEGGGVEAGELALARTRARETLLAQVDASGGLALAIARRLQVDQEPSAFGTVLRQIDALDAEAVQAAARRWLRPDQAPLLMVIRPENVGSVIGAGFGALEVFRIRTGTRP